MEDICRVKDCLSKRSLMKRWRLHQTLIGSCRNIRYTNNVKSECVLNSLLRQYIVLWSSQIIWFCYKSQSIKSSIEYFKGQKKKIPVTLPSFLYINWWTGFGEYVSEAYKFLERLRYSWISCSALLILQAAWIRRLLSMFLKD